MKSILKKKKQVKSTFGNFSTKIILKSKKKCVVFFIFFGGSHTARCHTAQEKKKMKAWRLPGLQSQCLCSSPHHKLSQ
jgi:hypothetical protein